MSDRVFPASKPTPTTPATAPNARPPPPPAAEGGTSKVHLYNPTARLPYRPQPHNRRHHHRSSRSYCCCCCFWTILIILILALLAAIASTVVYMMYRPHRPAFTVASLHVHRLSLTTAGDSSSHLSTLFNLTLSSKNPNSRISFFYDPFSVAIFSAENGVLVGNGTLPSFFSGSKNETTFWAVAVSTSNDLDADSVNKLRSDLKKNDGSIELELRMDTRVEVKLEKLKSKKVGIRVTCDGIKGVVPKGKTPVAANTSGAKCKVDLRIKIWKWTF